jgi:glutamyl-tRNA synthetase
MAITHVLRGEDHLTNTPRQLLLLEALDLPAPEYGHLAMIVGADGSPLSKRHGSRSLRELREVGFLPGAVNNYLARLGHTYEADGWLEPAELAAGFVIEHLGRAPARYDEAQLLHWQAEAVMHQTDAQCWTWMGAAVWAWVPAERRDEFIATVRPNVRFPADALDWAERLFGTELRLDEDARAVITTAGGEFFQQALAAYATHGAAYQPLVEQLKTTTGKKGKALFMPLRAALTGVTHGPELARLLALIPTELARRRLQAWC